MAYALPQTAKQRQPAPRGMLMSHSSMLMPGGHPASYMHSWFDRTERGMYRLNGQAQPPCTGGRKLVIRLSGRSKGIGGRAAGTGGTGTAFLNREMLSECSAVGDFQGMYDPPFTCKTWPVMALASSEARNTAVRAI